MSTTIPSTKEEKEYYAEIQVCNFCDKPHWGYKDVNKRCVCDTSGNFHYEGFIVNEEGRIKYKSN